MEIGRLIEQLRRFGGELGATPLNNVIGQYMLDAADVLSMLQVENEKLRDELEQAKAERDAALKDIWTPQWISCKYGTGCDFISARTGRPDCAGCGGWEWRGIKED